jgi:excisionase family DNA binding protein
MTSQLAISITAAAEKLSISRAWAYQLAKRGELPTIRLGRRVLVPVAELEQLVAGSQQLPEKATS